MLFRIVIQKLLTFNKSSSVSVLVTIFGCPICSQDFNILGEFFFAILYAPTAACEHCAAALPFPILRSDLTTNTILQSSIFFLARIGCLRSVMLLLFCLVASGFIPNSSNTSFTSSLFTASSSSHSDESSIKTKIDQMFRASPNIDVFKNSEMIILLYYFNIYLLFHHHYHHFCSQ